VNSVTQVPPWGIWTWHRLKDVFSSLDWIYWDDIQSSDAEMKFPMLPSIMQGLHWRLKPLLNAHCASSLMCQPIWKRLYQARSFLMLYSESTTTRSYFNRAGIRCTVKEKLLSWLVVQGACDPGHVTAILYCWVATILRSHAIILPTHYISNITGIHLWNQSAIFTTCIAIEPNAGIRARTQLLFFQ